MASISDRNQAEAWLRSRIEDSLFLCERRSMPTFIGFLDESEQQIARKELSHTDADRYRFWGGYDDAERCVLGCFPDYLSADDASYPLERLTFRYRSDKVLTHRDVLGTLLAQGIKRETIGDILCDEGRVVIFIRSEITPYIREQVIKIGGIGVKLDDNDADALPVAHHYESIQDTIASPGLDAIVKVLTNTSREKAAQMIVAGSVSVNHVVSIEVSAAVTDGSVISVRGFGRFIVDRIGPPTKKGRLFLSARKCV